MGKLFNRKSSLDQLNLDPWQLCSNHNKVRIERVNGLNVTIHSQSADETPIAAAI
jgi:hypothetical protein